MVHRLVNKTTAGGGLCSLSVHEATGRDSKEKGPSGERQKRACSELPDHVAMGDGAVFRIQAMKEDAPEPPKSSGMIRIWRELKRRKVMRVASVYAVVGWLLIQIAATTFENFGIPVWAFRFVTLMVVLGFPISLIIPWAFQITPEGIVKTQSLADAGPGADADAGPQKGRNLMAYLLGAAVPTLIFGSLALVFFIRSRSGPDKSSNSLSIAAMPLLSMSSLDDGPFIAGGVQEDILTNLSRIAGLQVVSRPSAMRYINSDKSLADIANDLGARYIVEGSVRRVANHARVAVQLIDAYTDTHLWANNYDRELLDVFATQSALARQISDSINLEKAGEIARLILDADIDPETIGITSDYFASLTAYAHFVLRELDETRSIADEFPRNRDEGYNAYIIGGYITLALLEIDQAAKLFVDFKKHEPDWWGTNIIATNHLSFREFLIHPAAKTSIAKRGNGLSFFLSAYRNIPKSNRWRTH